MLLIAVYILQNTLSKKKLYLNELKTEYSVWTALDTRTIIVV